MNRMDSSEKIRRADLSALKVVHYPDPRLREVCTPIKQVGPDVRALAERMLELMFAGKGVGLAAPQVGLTVRMFVASPSFEPSDGRVYVNPRILDADGKQDEQEGCLSFPGITCKIARPRVVVVQALGPDGRSFTETGADLAARIFAHEIDHLDGRLLVDRMSTVAKLGNRRALRDLEDSYVRS